MRLDEKKHYYLKIAGSSPTDYPASVGIPIDLLDPLRVLWKFPSYYPNDLSKSMSYLGSFFYNFVYEVNEGTKFPIMLFDNIPKLKNMNNVDKNGKSRSEINVTVKLNANMSSGGPIQNRNILYKYAKNEYFLTYLSNAPVHWNYRLFIKHKPNNYQDNDDYIMNAIGGLSRDGLIRMCCINEYDKLTTKMKYAILAKRIKPMLQRLVKDKVIKHKYNNEDRLHYIIPGEWFYNARINEE